MAASPLSLTPAFSFGPVTVTWTVVTTWGVVACLTLAIFIATRKLSTRPGKSQAVLELFVTTIDHEILASVPGDPARLRSLIGTLFLLILAANWSSLIPGVDPPTAHLETDAALAVIVFGASIFWGIRSQGIKGWLMSFIQPNILMLPLNLLSQITRHFSLMIRLFGNVMSGAFVISIVLSLAGLLMPIPFMALDMLTGAIQAYIFAMLALVFIGSGVGESLPDTSSQSKEKQHD